MGAGPGALRSAVRPVLEPGPIYKSMDQTKVVEDVGLHGDGRRRWVLAAASISSFIVALDLLVVTTALDTIRRDLAASPSALQWTVTAYSVSFATLLLTGAALGDRFGRRRMMLIGLATFAASSAAAAMAGSVGALVAAHASYRGRPAP